MKKTPSKVAHNQPPTFFLCTGPAAQTAQNQKIPHPQKPLKMQDWVFRLGLAWDNKFKHEQNEDQTNNSYKRMENV